MAVYDRWHRDPQPGDKPCRCGRGRNKLYPGKDHQKGDRWQVRWRDPVTGKQKARNFALKEGKNTGLSADAFDAKIRRDIDTRNYTDPDAGDVTLQAYGEQWRKSRTHGESAAAGLEARLRCHVYEGEPGSGRTPKGGAAIGQHAMGLLAARPSLSAAWVAAMPLADSSKRLVMGDVSAVFQAAIEDGIVGRDPVKSSAVDRPGKGGGEAQPYAPAEVAGIAACMPERFGLVPYLGAGTGMREMEMAGLGADDIVRGKKPKVRVLRQLKEIGGELRFGPVKNKKPHDVPVPAELVERIDAHAERFPPMAVTLPWHEPGSKLHGTLFTVRLVLSHEGGAAAGRNVMDAAWRTGVSRWRAPQVLGGRRRRSLARGYGIHRLRHTAASAWLRGGIDVVRAAAWLGDTVEMVTQTYLHLMPDDHDGEDAGRAASAAFLGACARSVQPEAGNRTSPLARVV